MSDAPITLLKSHNLRITNCRIDVIQHFINNKGALSHQDLEDNYKQYDRATIYRTLISLLNAKILHKIPSDNRLVTYGLCRQKCNDSHEIHFDNHIHFKCDICGNIECLDEIEVPKISLPEGYKVERVNLIVDGVCNECA